METERKPKKVTRDGMVATDIGRGNQGTYSMTIDLSPEALARIKGAAEKATPGPWENDSEKSYGSYGSGEDNYEGYHTSLVMNAKGHRIVDASNNDVGEVHEDFDDEGFCHAWDDQAEKDCAHIANCDPQTVLAMVARIEALEAENARLREAALDAISALAASVHLLEHGGKKAAPSDKMFAQMLIDYNAALDRARATLEGETWHAKTP